MSLQPRPRKSNARQLEDKPGTQNAGTPEGLPGTQGVTTERSHDALLYQRLRAVLVYFRDRSPIRRAWPCSE